MSLSHASGLLQGRLRVEPTPARVAAVVAEQLSAALSRGEVLGLATGRTMEPVYANLDEYVGLGPADPGSFARFMEQQLAGPLGLAPGQLQLPDGLAHDPDAEARRYGAALAAAGGAALQLLGLGLNGHVGFNEPPCPADAPCRCLALSPATRAQNAAAKAQILRRALQDAPGPEVPASWLQCHPGLEVVVDRAAAAQLALS